MEKVLATGTVTFLFTDIEGSTQRWEARRHAMQAALRRHDELLHAAATAHCGCGFKTIGDAFCVVFPAVQNALEAALAARRAFAAEDWSAVDGIRVRMAIRTGVTEGRGWSAEDAVAALQSF